jgi:hypothetical protein
LKSVVLAREAQLESGREATQLLAVATSKRPQWDCESILTTHSTLNNHPTLIREPATGASSRKKRRIANLRQLEQVSIFLLIFAL